MRPGSEADRSGDTVATYPTSTRPPMAPPAPTSSLMASPWTRALINSIFDDDGAAIIVHERPDAYGEEESDTGNRLACGVIKPS